MAESKCGYTLGLLQWKVSLIQNTLQKVLIYQKSATPISENIQVIYSTTHNNLHKRKWCLGYAFLHFNLLEINAKIILRDKFQNSEHAHLYANKIKYTYLAKPESGAPQFLFNIIYLSLLIV